MLGKTGTETWELWLSESELCVELLKENLRSISTLCDREENLLDGFSPGMYVL